MIKSLFYILGICAASATMQQHKFEDQDRRLKIVVLDSPIADSQVNQPFMCKNGTHASIGFKSHFSETEANVYGIKFRHGENIVGIIASRMDQRRYCIYHVAWFQPGLQNADGTESSDLYITALDTISKLKNVAGINMSLSGTNLESTYYEKEFKLVEEMTSRGVKVVVAAGNENRDLTETDCFTYPACLQKKVSHPENFYVVTGLKPNKVTNRSTYLRMDYEEWERQGDPAMTGSSQATAHFTSKLFSKEFFK